MIRSPQEINPGAIPAIKGAKDVVRQDGWENGRCVYFDAIEATDYFVSLENKEEGENE